jgi:hypothetical protein
MDKDKDIRRLSALPGILSIYSYCLVIVAFMFADFLPRFIQGDSISFLYSYEWWFPPDRSWAFGSLTNIMLRLTHGFSAFMLMQIGIFACLLAAMRIFFSDSGKSRVIYGVIVVLLALDPLLEFYTRSFMADFLANAVYLVVLLALFLVVRGGEHTRNLCLSTLLAITATVVAVFIRYNNALIIELTVLLVVIIGSYRLSKRQWFALAIVALGPFIAVGSLLVSNSIVFADKYPHELFLDRLDGVRLASVYAPALQMSDFQKVGIPITTSEFRRLDLTNYNKRNSHIHKNSPYCLNQFIKDKRKINQDYTRIVDETAKGLVWNAFRRNPISLAKVYAWNAFLYAEPSNWHRSVYWETGQWAPLPSEFVAFVNARSYLKIEPEITKIRSPLVRMLETFSYLYPLQLLLGLVATAYLMIRERANPSTAVLTAGLLAVLASTPLYSVAVIPRFLLGAIFISYLLIGIAIQDLMTHKTITS